VLRTSIGGGEAFNLQEQIWAHYMGTLAIPGRSLDKMAVTIVVWAMNDVCNNDWQYCGCPNLGARIEVFCNLFRHMEEVVVVVAGSGSYWNIKDTVSYDNDRDRAIKAFRSQGIPAIDGVPFLRTVEFHRHKDGWHFAYDEKALPLWSAWLHQLVRLAVLQGRSGGRGPLVKKRGASSAMCCRKL